MLLSTWQIESYIIRAFVITPIHIVIILSLIVFIGFSKQERVAVKDIVLKKIHQKE